MSNVIEMTTANPLAALSEPPPDPGQKMADGEAMIKVRRKPMFSSGPTMSVGVGPLSQHEKSQPTFLAVSIEEVQRATGNAEAMAVYLNEIISRVTGAPYGQSTEAGGPRPVPAGRKAELEDQISRLHRALETISSHIETVAMLI